MSLGHLQAAIALLSTFLLGIPLTGRIPEPAGLERDTTVVSVTTQVVGQHLVTALVWGSLYTLAAFVLLISRRPVLPLLARHPYVLLLALYAFSSAAWSPAPTKAIIDAAQVMGSMAIALVVAVRYQNRVVDLARDLGAALGLGQMLNLVFLLSLPLETHQYDGRWAGLTGSANYLGALAFLAVWLNLIAFVYGSHPWRSIAAALICVAVVNLIGSGSVTATLSIAAGAISLMYWTWGRKTSRYRPIRKFSLVMFAVVLLVASLVLGLDALAALLGRDPALSGRLGIWAAAIQLVVEKPIFGFGFGSDTKSLRVLHWATSFHNGYLDIAVKLGLVGVLLLFMAILSHLRDLVRQVEPQGASKLRLILPLVIALMVYNLGESAFLVARSPVWLMFMIVVFLVAAIPAPRRAAQAGA